MERSGFETAGVYDSKGVARNFQAPDDKIYERNALNFLQEIDLYFEKETRAKVKGKRSVL